MDRDQALVLHRLHLSLHAMESTSPTPEAQARFTAALGMCRDYDITREQLVEDLWNFRSHPIVARALVTLSADLMYDAYDTMQGALRTNARFAAAKTSAAPQRTPTLGRLRGLRRVHRLSIADRQLLTAATEVAEQAHRTLEVIDRIDQLPMFDDADARAARDELALDVADCGAEANALRYTLGDLSVSRRTLVDDAVSVAQRAQRVDSDTEIHSEAVLRNHARLSELGIRHAISHSPVEAAPVSAERLARIIHIAQRPSPGHPGVDGPAR